MVECPICSQSVKSADINLHIDSGCETHVEAASFNSQDDKARLVSCYFRRPAAKKIVTPTTPAEQFARGEKDVRATAKSAQEEKVDTPVARGTKRSSPDQPAATDDLADASNPSMAFAEPPAKKPKISALQRAAPLAERMRPRTLDEVRGQDLVGSDGVLRGLIETDRVPSMILWGGAGTGKTTIARVIANMVGSRFIEINSTSSGVGECKKLFSEAKSELSLTGRKTIIFCDEIHRFSKSQQDVFLGPVESGQITLIGATTENPSFKVQDALLSRCRTFTLQKLGEEDVERILRRAVEVEGPSYEPSELVDDELFVYLSAFADGDAWNALNLLELAMNLSNRPEMTKDGVKAALTKTLVYDRAGDQHCKKMFEMGSLKYMLTKLPDDTISALHKSVRGSDPDAALYYLARMLQSGEDPLYIAVSQLPGFLFKFKERLSIVCILIAADSASAALLSSRPKMLGLHRRHFFH